MLPHTGSINKLSRRNADPAGIKAISNSRNIPAMTLFHELNSAGRTVVMVTHNPENTRHADRGITLRDGMVVASH